MTAVRTLQRWREEAWKKINLGKVKTMEEFISILNSQADENMMKYSIGKKEKIKNFELKKHTIQVGRTTHV